MNASTVDPEAVLSFWLGELDECGTADAGHTHRWFAKDEAFDREIAARFRASHDAAMDGRLDGWLDQPRGRLAHVIVLDQFSRNLFRGTSRSFAADARALAAAQDGVARGHDRALGLDERWFLYMPFMHAEDLASQDRSVELFAALAGGAPPARRETMAARAKFAGQHHEIVARFGRFPHRNAILGRPSTAEESEFLKQPGSGF